MTTHDWEHQGPNPYGADVMTCRKCGASTNNAFLASIYPCKEPAMPNPSTAHDEAAQAELIRKRREMRRAYVAPELPEVEPVQFVRPECRMCSDTLYDDNRSPVHGVCDRCHEESEALKQPENQAGFWSHDFAMMLVAAVCAAFILAVVIGSVAWWIGSLFA